MEDTTVDAATTATMEVHFSYRGKVQAVQVSRTATGAELMVAAQQALLLLVAAENSNDEKNADSDVPRLKLLWKGKRLAADDDDVLDDVSTAAACLMQQQY
jgi:hypothetical protein